MGVLGWGCIVLLRGVVGETSLDRDGHGGQFSVTAVDWKDTGLITVLLGVILPLEVCQGHLLLEIQMLFLVRHKMIVLPVVDNTHRTLTWRRL